MKSCPCTCGSTYSLLEHELATATTWRWCWDCRKAVAKAQGPYSDRTIEQANQNWRAACAVPNPTTTTSAPQPNGAALLT
ncbi:MAG: hypothetical protein JWR07_1929 [Nevskia sp.]|nr:hypothetical protein [Nevskia sp.]